jgi:radical SAM protein with 4Fe4S-binding SPASM domain
MTINMHEIKGIIKLAAELGIDRIKGHHLWTHFPELEQLSYLKDDITMNQWNDVVSVAYKAIDDYKRKDGSKIRLENFQTISALSSGAIPSDHICPFLGKELWISATGKISPCCAPDKLRNQLGDFGNIADTSIQHVLISEQYQDLVKNYNTKELCRKCTMRKPTIH